MNHQTESHLRLCSYCKAAKPTSEFHKKVDKRNDWSGLSSVCRACLTDYRKSKDPYFNLKAALRLRKGDANKKGIPFNITLDDLLPIPDACPIFGIPLGVGLPGGSDYSVSIDRIIPSLGYVKGNVILISLKANRIKNDASPEELRKVFIS